MSKDMEESTKRKAPLATQNAHQHLKIQTNMFGRSQDVETQNKILKIYQIRSLKKMI